LAADARRVAETVRRRRDRADDPTLRVRLRRERARLREGEGREHAARPRAEVLRGEVLPARLPEVRIHVGRSDALPPPVVEVLEELVAGEIATALHDTREARIRQLDGDQLPALRAE